MGDDSVKESEGKPLTRLTESGNGDVEVELVAKGGESGVAMEGLNDESMDRRPGIELTNSKLVADLAAKFGDELRRNPSGEGRDQDRQCRIHGGGVREDESL